MLTPWGYEVAEPLGPVIDAARLDELTGGVLASTAEQKAAKLAGVSAAIRDWCGWHVAPAAECTYTGEGDGRVLLLPAMAVRSVSSLQVCGREAEFEWKQSGIVRLARGRFPDKWGSVRCRFEAGYGADALGEIVAQIACNALVAAPGIAEEHAGSVGATYNKTGDGITGGVSLLARDKELLAPYRLAGAWLR